MKQTGFRAGTLVGAVLALAACGQASLGPPQAASAPPPAAPAPPLPDLRGLAGTTYADFTAQPETARFSPAGLALSAPDQMRLAAAMAAPSPGWIAHGGGAQALVLTGCAVSGCASARAVVAIDVGTGAVFAGVRDAEGLTELRPNPRLEALLRLSSPERAWDTPAPGPSRAD